MTAHPETVDPDWFQLLVRRAFEREMRSLLKADVPADEAMEQAMWYVFELRTNLVGLYEAGKETSS